MIMYFDIICLNESEAYHQFEIKQKNIELKLIPK